MLRSSTSTVWQLAFVAKDCVMTTATNIQENAEDILAEAKEINEQRNKEEVFEDESQAEESFKEEEAATAEA